MVIDSLWKFYWPDFNNNNNNKEMKHKWILHLSNVCLLLLLSISFIIIFDRILFHINIYKCLDFSIYKLVKKIPFWTFSYQKKNRAQNKTNKALWRFFLPVYQLYIDNNKSTILSSWVKVIFFSFFLFFTDKKWEKEKKWEPVRVCVCVCDWNLR